MKKIITPLNIKRIEGLKVGEWVFLSGVIYTARDQAHKKLTKLIKAGKKLPFNLEGQVIFYCGPTPAPRGKVIGACGPTTSSRMDKFTPLLLQNGLKGMIGKGNRSKEIVQAIERYKAVYFLAPAGAGAYLSRCVRKSNLIAYPELGAEAIYRLVVKDFPLFVGVDSQGNNVYKGDCNMLKADIRLSEYQ